LLRSSCVDGQSETFQGGDRSLLAKAAHKTTGTALMGGWMYPSVIVMILGVLGLVESA